MLGVGTPVVLYLTQPGAVVLVGPAGTHAFLATLLDARAAEAPSHTAVVRGGARGEAARWMSYGGHGAGLLLAVTLFAARYRRGW